MPSSTVSTRVEVLRNTSARTDSTWCLASVRPWAQRLGRRHGRRRGLHPDPPSAADERPPGQWAFPGGRSTRARRRRRLLGEIEEEVGLCDLDLLGRLDDYPTRSGYEITPFVFWAGAEAEPTANPDEVASIHRIAITELLRPNSPRFVDIPESDRPVIQVPVGEDLIHAPTGAVMYQFRAVATRSRRTGRRYDQPVFAWQ